MSVDTAQPGQSLGRAEVAALRMAGDGLTVAQIARRLGKARGTVKHQLEAARIKLGAQNTGHALVLAVRSGQVSL